MKKDLKEKAVDIKGKKYVLVSDRVLYFNEVYTNGSIQTQLVSDVNSGRVIVKAVITPDHKTSERFFTGFSQAVIGDGMVNKTSALENAETSAVGRGLALMGIGVIESIASVDELNKAFGSEGKQPERIKTAFEKQIESETDLEKLQKIRTKIATMSYGAPQKNRMYATVDERIRELKSGGTIKANTVARQEEVTYEAQEELAASFLEEQIANE